MHWHRRTPPPYGGKVAANDHGSLSQQAGFVDIAIALKARAGEIRIAKEGKALEHSALRWHARQGPQAGGIEGQPTSPGMELWISDHSRHCAAMAVPGHFDRESQRRRYDPTETHRQRWP
jgi:hypothetical protein